MATPPPGLLLNVLAKFEQTDEFRNLAQRTREDYKDIIDKRIAPEFGDLPLAALSESKHQCRGEFKAWRDRLSLKSRRQADYAWAVLARIMSVALDRGWIAANPCEKGGRLYHGKNDYADKWRRDLLDGSPIISDWEQKSFKSAYDYWESADGPWRDPQPASETS